MHPSLVNAASWPHASVGVSPTQRIVMSSMLELWQASIKQNKIPDYFLSFWGIPQRDVRKRANNVCLGSRLGFADVVLARSWRLTGHVHVNGNLECPGNHVSQKTTA